MPYSHLWYISYQTSSLPWSKGALHFLLYVAWNLVFSDNTFSSHRFTGLFCLFNGKDDQGQLKAKFCSFIFWSHFGPCKGQQSEIGLLSLKLHCYTSAFLLCLWRDNATARPAVKGLLPMQWLFPECSPCIDRNTVRGATPDWEFFCKFIIYFFLTGETFLGCKCFLVRKS